MNLQNQSEALLKLKRLNIILSSLVVLLCVTQIIIVGVLTFHNERVVIVPPDLKASASIKGNSVSASYAEDMSAYFAHLLLDRTPQNVGYHNALILDHIAPQHYAAFKAKLMREKERIKKDDLSSSFALSKLEVDTEQKQILLTGMFSLWVGEDRIIHERRTYELLYSVHRSRLFLEGFKERKGQ